MSPHGKFSLFKRSNGYYYILFEERGRTRWKSTRCRLKADALRALTKFAELIAARPNSASLEEFTKEFLEYAKVNHAKATSDIAAISLRHLKAVAGNALLPALTHRHLDRYKAKRLTDGVSPVTVNVELRALRSIMNVALRWELIQKNPFAGLKLMTVPETLPQYLSKADFQKLFVTIKENWLKEVVGVAVLTGLRRGEILNLRWSDVDLIRRVIQIHSSGTFKTKRGKRRTVPLNEVAYRLLATKAAHTTSEYVFTFRGRKIAEYWLSHRFKFYIRKAGLPEGLHFHSLRHTFASWLVQDGVSLYAVQRLLGHSTIAVTEIYSHLQPEQLHSTVNRIDVSFKLTKPAVGLLGAK